MYTTESLHSAVVEIIVNKHARCRYTTIQNWANNIYNLVTKRAMAYENAVMEWIDGNLGSRLTMKYPAVYMMEPGARGEILSIAFASAGQHQDAGAKLVHCAPNTSSRIISKSISKNGGRASYRGLVKVEPGAKKSKSNVVCDALILDPQEPQRYLPLYRDRRAGRDGRPRGQRLADRRGAAVLSHQPRPDRSRGQHDDRQRLYRAAGQRAADGIRRRDEPPDRAADGRLGGLKTPAKAVFTDGRAARCRLPPPFWFVNCDKWFAVRCLEWRGKLQSACRLCQARLVQIREDLLHAPDRRSRRIHAGSFRGLSGRAPRTELGDRVAPASLADFRTARLPSRREEEWMRTDIRLFRLDRFGLPSEQAGRGRSAAAAADARGRTGRTRDGAQQPPA